MAFGTFPSPLVWRSSLSVVPWGGTFDANGTRGRLANWEFEPRCLVKSLKPALERELLWSVTVVVWGSDLSFEIELMAGVLGIEVSFEGSRPPWVAAGGPPVFPLYGFGVGNISKWLLLWATPAPRYNYFYVLLPLLPSTSALGLWLCLIFLSSIEAS